MDQSEGCYGCRATASPLAGLVSESVSADDVSERRRCHASSYLWFFDFRMPGLRKIAFCLRCGAMNQTSQKRMYIGGKVECPLNVGNPIRADEMADIAVVPAHHRGLHLNAKTATVMFDDEVVGSGLSPRFANVQTFFCGACHEAHFHPFAALLGGFEVQNWISHGLGP